MLLGYFRLVKKSIKYIMYLYCWINFRQNDHVNRRLIKVITHTKLNTLKCSCFIVKLHYEAPKKCNKF